MSDEQYPKVVYPGGPDVKHTAAGSGVVVKNEAEEKWVLDGKQLDDFGKPEAEIKAEEEAKADKPTDWDKK